MMLHPRAEYTIERGKPFAQSHRLSFRHFTENDFLLEHVTTSRDGPPVNRSSFTFEHSSRGRDDARIQSRDEMNRMRQCETGKEV
ncbi:MULTISPECIES: hypothetical protein [Burkholderia cepacia complex]|uniref:hypothetical protein n=1 Tax=Burkholderia cepacia complex TaxID=87882 RepID=UPI0013DE5786|nr:MULTISPECIES: hypothetical protein [Burkholderia cepacia complex]